jgi:hypothetical protein
LAGVDGRVEVADVSPNDPEDRAMVKPICFMVMPFRTKETGANPPSPNKVDFDALWEKAFLPLIEAMGYQPVRADQDLGALIIKDMLERLYFSDLVLADLTIPNGNVYYEVGVRHALKNAGCVLLSADWSRQLFDLDQIRQARYPLAEGTVTDDTAAKIRSALTEVIAKLADGSTPVFQSLPGYPGDVVMQRASVIREHLDALSEFQATVRAIRSAPNAERKGRTLDLSTSVPPAMVKLPSVALEMIYLLRDFAEWPDALAYIDGLPAAIRDLPIVKEQHCLAQSMTGDHTKAIGALEELIQTSGDSSERQGLLGGRYKRLYRAATEPADKLRYLAKSIEHYERGMTLDLNDYFPSCNLPALYRERSRRGDDERARAAATVARIACQRAISRGADDVWTRPTLLGLAFFEGDLDKVEELCDQVASEGAAKWQLKTTVDDLTATVARTPDGAVKDGLQSSLLRLKSLLPSP